MGSDCAPSPLEEAALTSFDSLRSRARQLAGMHDDAHDVYRVRIFRGDRHVAAGRPARADVDRQVALLEIRGGGAHLRDGGANGIARLARDGRPAGARTYRVGQRQVVVEGVSEL